MCGPWRDGGRRPPRAPAAIEQALLALLPTRRFRTAIAASLATQCVTRRLARRRSCLYAHVNATAAAMTESFERPRHGFTGCYSPTSPREVESLFLEFHNARGRWPAARPLAGHLDDMPTAGWGGALTSNQTDDFLALSTAVRRATRTVAFPPPPSTCACASRGRHGDVPVARLLPRHRAALVPWRGPLPFFIYPHPLRPAARAQPRRALQ